MASDQLSNPAVASEPICSEIDAWVTILRRALRFTFERSAQTSLLTAREEIELAARMKKGDQRLELGGAKQTSDWSFGSEMN